MAHNYYYVHIITNYVNIITSHVLLTVMNKPLSCESKDKIDKYVHIIVISCNCVQIISIFVF